MTIAFLALNVFVYFVLQRGGILDGPDDGIVIKWGAIPYEVTHPGDHCEPVDQAIACEGQPGVVGRAEAQAPTVVTLFTSMFMHGSILHLAGNMLFLWIFGNNIEDSMGRARFIAFYLLGGLAALALQTVADPDAAIPAVGASGAIAAILGGYALLYRHARVLTLIFIVFFVTLIELPAVFVLGFWFLQQVLFGVYDLNSPTGEGGGVAYFAHIGGFVFGLALVKAFITREKDVPPRYPVY